MIILQIISAMTLLAIFVLLYACCIKMIKESRQFYSEIDSDNDKDDLDLPK